MTEKDKAIASDIRLYAAQLSTAVALARKAGLSVSFTYQYSYMSYKWPLEPTISRTESL